MMSDEKVSIWFENGVFLSAPDTHVPIFGNLK